jgi:hypothetical protein
MRWLKQVLRLGGWLLTPLVAWAASHLGGWIGAVIAGRVANPETGVAITAAAVLLSALAAMLAWMRLLRWSPRLRHSLHLTREGIPETEEVAAESGAGTPPRADGPLPS